MRKQVENRKIEWILNLTKHIRCIIVLLEQYNLRECVFLKRFQLLGSGTSQKEWRKEQTGKWSERIGYE